MCPSCGASGFFLATPCPSLKQRTPLERAETNSGDWEGFSPPRKETSTRSEFVQSGGERSHERAEGLHERPQPGPGFRFFGFGVRVCGSVGLVLGFLEFSWVFLGFFGCPGMWDPFRVLGQI